MSYSWSLVTDNWTNGLIALKDVSTEEAPSSRVVKSAVRFRRISLFSFGAFQVSSLKEVRITQYESTQHCNRYEPKYIVLRDGKSIRHLPRVYQSANLGTSVVETLP